MIVALAGHVDHGKTSLVKALTGVDTDRLEEERRRGLTIDLGFAYTDIDGERIGFVDVPGHHRFVHNMVAGVASRQFALLVVAADDGPMPQTREHLDILSLLGLRGGAVALTKIDLVTTSRVDDARAEIAALLAGTFLDSAPCVALSAATGHGLDELRSVLAAAPRAAHADSNDECFRLAIDRAFNVKGAGLVVTGTVHSGGTSAGEELILAPRGERVRVRSIRVQDRSAELALPGDRCALNVVGVDRDDVQRGMWLVAPETHFVTSRIVVRLAVLRSFPHAVRHWTQVHVHHATAHTTGRIALLDSPPIAPGMSARVEIELDQVLSAKHGDRVVLRDQAASCTLGGGDVIAIDPPKSGRRRAERLARLELLAAPTAAEALHALLARCDDGIDAEAFRQTWNLKPFAFDQLVGEHHPIGTLDGAGRRFVIAAEHVDAAESSITERLGAYHKAAPYSAGLRVDRLRQLVPVPTRLLDAAIDAALRSGKIAHTNGHYHIAAHRPKLAPQDDALLKRIAVLLEGRQPPSVGDIAKQLRIDLATLHKFVDRMAALGLLVRVSETRCFLPEAITHLKEIASKLSRTADGFTAAEFRDASGIGRNLAIDVLEHFDRRGVTRRHGERRRALHPSDP